MLVTQVLINSKARSTTLASPMKMDESSGLRCILLWLPDITEQPTFESYFDPSLYEILISTLQPSEICGFDSDFSQSVNRKVFQVVLHTKLEYLV